MIAPEAGAGSIAIAGAALVAAGALFTGVARRARRAPSAVAPTQDPPAVEMPAARQAA